jgi:tripartite-type tricarboxylate transporter receptor subunit TctC
MAAAATVRAVGGKNPMLCRRTFIASIVLAPCAQAAAATDWPRKAIRIVYPYAAGSAGDGAARLLAQGLAEAFGQAVVVENRVGANGTLAAHSVARAAADGYTLFWATTPQIAISPVMTTVNYDPVKDFTPISAVLANSWVLIVNRQVPVKTLAEFVDYVRARPNLVYAQGGVGSVGHLAMAMFLKRAGLEMPGVSYQGNAPALNDVVAGHVPTMFSVLGDAVPHIASGSIRAIAVSSGMRSPQIPDVPTVAESGYPGFRAVAWNGLVAPAGTPAAIVHRVATAVARVAKERKFVERLASFGVESVGNSPEEFAAMIAADMALWPNALRDAGIKGQ